MTGNTVGSIRRTSNVVPGGSEGSSRFACASTWSMAATMSWPQSKLMEISALPRLVVERTPRTPGVDRTASSTG